MPPIEHAALPNRLLERFSGMDAHSQLVQCLQFLASLSKPGLFSPTMMVDEHPQRIVATQKCSQKVMLAMSKT